MVTNIKTFDLVQDFQELISTSYHDEINALYWKRELKGDFSEIVAKLKNEDHLKVIQPKELLQLQLSQNGNRARQTILNDFQLLESNGSAPVLNLIKNYEKDDSFFPTDVYSFHVDRSPVPTDTFLCTYHGASSDILPNSQATQKILIPEIREQLLKLYNGPKEGFENFLSDYFFDLHYQEKPSAAIINLGLGNLWRLSVDHPNNDVLPCIHRAPQEKIGESRLMMIC